MTAAALTGAGNVTTAAVNAGTSLTLTRPSNAVSGTVVIAAVFGRNATAAPSTPPTGWTLLGANSQTAPGWSGVYAKVLGGSEPASYAWAGFASGRLVGVMAVTTGLLTPVAVDVVGAGVTSITTTESFYNLTSVTTTAAGDLILACIAQNNTSGATTGITTNAAGFTTVGSTNTTTGASESVIHLAQWTQPSAGATGTQQFASSLTTTQSSGEGFLLALKAAASPPTVVDAAASGSGTLSATGIPKQTATAAVSGTGTLSATRTPKLSAAGALSGTGTLTATVAPSLTLSRDLTGTGVLTCIVYPQRLDVALSGSGVLTAAIPTVSVRADLSGLGTLTATTHARVSGWEFRTPTVEVAVRMAGRGLYATQPWGLTVYRTAGGEWISQLSPPFDALAAADRAYRGGVLHYVSEAEAAELLAAGFSVSPPSGVGDVSVTDLAIADSAVAV